MEVLSNHTALTCKKLSKCFEKDNDSFWALKDVSFDLKEGEILGVVGRNGAGKSSLLKLISKIIKPTSGEIFYRGRLASIIEIGTGFHADLSGKENVYMNASLFGYKKSEIDQFYDDIVEFSGLDGYMDTPVKNYSSGMYLRLAFSIAFQSNIDVLLLDEVIAVGDVDFRNKCYNKIRELSQAGVSIIIVSHNTNQIVDFCHRCLLLDQGELMMEGLPLEVINRYLELTSVHEGITVGSKLQSEKLELQKAIQFETDLSSFELEEIRMNSFELFVNGEQDVETVYTEDCLLLRISYDQLVDEWLEFAWYLTNMDGQKVLMDSPFWRKNYEYKKSSLGSYQLDCTIPENLLTRGVYKLGLIISKQNWEPIIEVPNVLRLKVDVTDSFKIGQYINSALHPHLEWQRTKK